MSNTTTGILGVSISNSSTSTSYNQHSRDTTTTQSSFNILHPLDQLQDLKPINAISPNFKLPVWAILLILVIMILTGLIITCCILCWFRNQCNKLFKSIKSMGKKRDDIENLVDFKPIPIPTSLYQEQVQPNVEKLAQNMKPTNNENENVEDTKFYGTLEYGLDYDFQKQELNLTIFEAKDLIAKDANGFSDPYVKVYLLPDKKKQFETRKIRKTLNPVYNETFTFGSLSYGDLKSKTILLTIFDYDKFSRHDQIGEIRIPLVERDLGDVIREWKDIAPPTGKKNQDNLLGSVCFSLRYAPTAGKITVTVFECKNLKKMDIGRLSDPYVKVGLFKCGKRVAKKKTSIKFYNLNPYYNESLTFDKVTEEEVKNGVFLVVTVVDYDRIGSSEPIGKVLVGPNVSGSGYFHWTEMLASPRRPVAKWHVLKDMEDDE